MTSPSERYQKLGLRESLQKCYRYPIACKELSFILREAFHQIPKSLQSIIFEDTLLAFRLLPEYACYCFSFFNNFFLRHNYQFVSLIKLPHMIFNLNLIIWNCGNCCQFPYVCNYNLKTMVTIYWSSFFF